MDPYEVLMLDATASIEEVEASYRRLVRYHRGVKRFNPLAVELRLQQITLAYNMILSTISPLAPTVAAEAQADDLACWGDSDESKFWQIVADIDGPRSDTYEIEGWNGQGCS